MLDGLLSKNMSKVISQTTRKMKKESRKRRIKPAESQAWFDATSTSASANASSDDRQLFRGNAIVSPFFVISRACSTWNKLTKFYLLYFFYFLCVILFSVRIRRKIFFIRTNVWGRMKTNFLSFRGQSYACAFFRFAYLDRNFLHLLITGYCSLCDRVLKEVLCTDCSL